MGRLTYHLFVELRDAEPWEREVSCNGCVNGVVVKVLELGRRASDGGLSSGFEWRMCADCLYAFRREVEE